MNRSALKALKLALEKGLDAAPEARKARAVEQGYLTNKGLKDIADNANDLKLVKVDDPPEWHSPSDGDFYEAYLNNSLLMEGDQRRLDNFLQYEIEKGLPGGVQSYGLKRPAYMMLDPSKHTNPEFDMNDLATFYHGAVGDIDQFNPNMLGRNTGAASANHAFFFSNNPKDADYYAELAKQRQPKQNRAFELMQRLSDDKEQTRKFIERYDRYNMDKHGMSSEAKDIAHRRIDRLQERMHNLAASDAFNDQYPSVLPVNLRVENPLFVDKRGTTYGDITSSLSKARKEGNDSVVFFDITDPEANSTHVAVFDPSRIRSINAMFDPERISSRDLLASMAGLGGIGMTDEMLQEDQPQEFSRGGLVKKGAKELFNELKSKLKQLDLYHESPGDVSDSIKEKGILSDYGSFFTAGQDSNYVTTYPKTSVKFFIPEDHFDLISPDMRYAGSSEEEDIINLLNEHPELVGADLSFPDSIPPEWIKGIDIIESPGTRIKKFASGGLVSMEYPYE